MAIDEKLQTVRHSCAHVMAEAVLRLFPGTKIAIGPAIEKGFYYDFDFPSDHKATEADFPAIEKEMRKIIAGNHDFVRKEVSKAQALELFKDQPYKIELSTMPEDHIGSEADWEIATAALADAIKSIGKDYEINPGDGAFYGTLGRGDRSPRRNGKTSRR